MKLSAPFGFIFLALTMGCDAERRTAQVSVENNTNDDLLSVSLIHKYSDDYNNDKPYSIIPSHQSGDGYLTVEYNTGPLTTGRDWWLLTWYSQDLKRQYYTHPNNFRGVFDALDKVAPSIIQAAVGSAVALVTSESGPVAAGAAAVAVALAKETTDQIFNSESTDGFKQHILRKEDQNAVTRIVINEDGTVDFYSRSGTSTTVYTSKASRLE